MLKLIYQINDKLLQFEESAAFPAMAVVMSLIIIYTMLVATL